MICKRCQKEFECRVDDILHCQCSGIALHPSTISFLGKTSWGCLCISCLEEIDATIQSLSGEEFPNPNELKAGDHYYIENGLWVFTERYHLLRGHCCKSGCRHCPYGFKYSEGFIGRG